MASIPPLPPHERVIWEGRSAWADQAILFLFIGAAAVRLLVAVRYGQWVTAALYAFAIVFFLTIGMVFRYAVYYQISAQRIRILSGWRRFRTQEIPLSRIRSVNVKRELLNRWLNVGSLEIETAERDGQSILLKGVPDPDRIRRQVTPLLSSLPSTQ
ncbi:MAG TPA: PH domain-containing protein [Nitrospiraceae bacterium]|nr:PH domain-containing protein [Nitrospiraceae bacterium]